MALARIVSASQAANYYYEDNPITSLEGNGENSEWQGNLQENLNIVGIVKAKDFKALLSGMDTRSDKILVREGVNKERRAGIDLALNIQNLGYKIDNYDNKFEISGITEEAIDTFSKRSKEIDDVEDKLRNKYKELYDAETRDIAVLSSRDKKNHNLTAGELKQKWESELSKDLITPIKEKDITLLDDITILNNAITEITTTESTFTSNRLLNIIINQNKGKHTLDEFKVIVDNAIKDNKIINLGEKKDIIHYSTNEMIDIENKIVEYARKGAKAIDVIVSNKKSINKVDNKTLTKGQIDFIEHIMTSKDKINIIQGDAGTGKTFAIK